MTASSRFFQADKTNVLVEFVKNRFLSAVKNIIQTAIVLDKNHPDGYSEIDESELAEGYVSITDTVEALQLNVEINPRLITIYTHGLTALISELDAQEINTVASVILSGCGDEEPLVRQFLEFIHSKEDTLKVLYRDIFNLAKDIYQLKPVAVDPYFKLTPNNMIYTHDCALQINALTIDSPRA